MNGCKKCWEDAIKQSKDKKDIYDIYKKIFKERHKQIKWRKTTVK